jgi:hypothetical protein
VTLEQFRATQAIVEIAAVTTHYNVAARTGAGLLKAAEERAPPSHRGTR